MEERKLFALLLSIAIIGAAFITVAGPTITAYVVRP